MIFNNFLELNSVLDLLISMFLVIGVFVILKIFQIIVLKKIKNLASKTRIGLDDATIDLMQKFNSFWYAIFALFLGFKYLNFPQEIEKWMNIVFIICLVFAVLSILGKLIDFLIVFYVKKVQPNAKDAAHLRSMLKIGKILTLVLIWIMIILGVLSNFGVNVSSIIASLGIGGIVVAIAVQNVLSDVFSSFSILIDKPFHVGDSITIGNDSGTVEKIGLKSTRIRTLRGEELVVSNRELTSTRILNFKRMKRRRDSFMISVEFSNTTKKLEKIPVIIQDIIENLEGVVFSRCHLSAFSSIGLVYETVYFVDTKEYQVFADKRQKIYLSIRKAFEKEKITFAYSSSISEGE